MVIDNQHVLLVPHVQKVYDATFGMRPVEMHVDETTDCVIFQAEGLPILIVPPKACEILPTRKHCTDDINVVDAGSPALLDFKSHNDGPIELYTVESRTLIILSVHTGAELVLERNLWEFKTEGLN